MLELFGTGRVIDVALVALVMEAVALLAWSWSGRSRLSPLDIVGQLLAGGCLLLALRFATGREVNAMGMLFLTAALPAHLFDLARRIRQSARR